MFKILLDIQILLKENIYNVKQYKSFSIRCSNPNQDESVICASPNFFGQPAQRAQYGV